MSHGCALTARESATLARHETLITLQENRPNTMRQQTLEQSAAGPVQTGFGTDGTVAVRSLIIVGAA
ncbi:hypothetical protein ELS19_06740 [Halogeometricum borinquense]|uniref:Uncharacterized protein n=1 Tax=Halogeometricum borinquense TaxID=60847 RepID=A0A482T7H1_9EURY|nr:hypothetical protein [Halogeometricum borinquense]RYJ13690.1 hypothetical protein ELS19_06740 [Halogeometricum borinquense]